jgi:malonyl-CoA/methylmalonyl-CoA synthetase
LSKAPEVLPEEAIYVLKKANATLVLLDHSKVELMASIQKQAIASNMNPIGWISIEISRAPLGDTLSVRTDANLTMSPERPALLLLTSGTSGPPKIVVHARRIFYSQPEPCGGPTDVFLFHRPVFWIGGIRMIMAVVLKGIRTEMLCYRAKADAVWERLRQGDITMMFLPVSLLSNMMMVFEEKLCQLPDAELRVYHEIMGNIRYIQCTGGLVPVRIKQFWRNLLTGTSLEVNYAGTEVGTAALGFSINSLEMAEVS